MRHPYIITYKESFMDKRCLCIVMDYADGGDLYTKIANQKKIGKGKFPAPSLTLCLQFATQKTRSWTGSCRWRWR